MPTPPLPWSIQRHLLRWGPGVLTVLTLAVGLTLAWRVLPGGALGYAALDTVVLSSHDAGRLAEVTVSPGDRVQAGQLVARLDTAALLARRDALSAELASLQAQARAAAASSRVARAELRAQLAREQAGIREAEATVAAVSAELDRLERLTAQGLAPDPADAQALRVDLATARAEVRGHTEAARALDEALADAPSEPSPTEDPAPPGPSGSQPSPAPGGDTAAALVAQADATRARLAELDALADLARLTAPADATVTAVHHRTGAVVTAGTPLVELTPPATAQVVACLSETEARDVHPAQQAWVVPSDGGPRRRATVTTVSDAVTPAAERCRALVNREEWVRTAQLRLDDGSTLSPGARVVVRLAPLEARP